MMKFPRSLALLMIAALMIPPLRAQSKSPVLAARGKKPLQHASDLANVIQELLKAQPLSQETEDDDADAQDTASGEEEKPPADDAPLKDLIAFWSNHDTANGSSQPEPSAKVRQRLLEACEDRPVLLPGLLGSLPETPDTYDRLYKLLNEEAEDEYTWKLMLRPWLRHKSNYFRDELVESVRSGKDLAYETTSDMEALATLDWDMARPLIENALASQSPLSGVALALLYERALKNGDEAQVENYRTRLKSLTADREAEYESRQRAIASLMKLEWNGQREWFVSLFADPTLSGIEEEVKEEPKATSEQDKGRPMAVGRVMDRLGDSLLVATMREDAEKWLPVVYDLIGSGSRTIHLGAVRCLAGLLSDNSGEEKMRREIAGRLLPWLSDPAWGVEEDRWALVRTVGALKMPEALPGLIRMLEDEGTQEIHGIADALAKLRDPRAIPALRRALDREKFENDRQSMIAALALCGGFMDEEMAAAIEAYARMLVSNGGAEKIENARYAEEGDPLPLKVSIGLVLDESEEIAATEGLAIRLLERARALRSTRPDVAKQILNVIQGAPLPIVEADLIERIGQGWVDLDGVEIALDNCDDWRKRLGDELHAIYKLGGYPGGVAAVLLADEGRQKDILEGKDANAQLALLASARYLRDKLPAALVARLFNMPDRRLAPAAEEYLKVEDSAEARRLVFARHPGEALILGADWNVPEYQITAPEMEDRLRQEVKTDQGLEAVYAIAMPRGNNGVIVRLRGGKAELSVYETEGRRRVRWLSDAELEDLKSFTSRREVEDLGPENATMGSLARHGGIPYEYLRLTKNGGRRIMLQQFRRSPKRDATLHEELAGLFHRLRHTGEYHVRYAIEEKIPGVEILFADDQLNVAMVCQEGRDVRLLAGEKRKGFYQDALPENLEWRDFSGGSLGGIAEEPKACRMSNLFSLFRENQRQFQRETIGPPSRAGDALVFMKYGEEHGVWKAEPGRAPELLVSDSYSSPLIIPDGKWLIAAKSELDGGRVSQWLVRYDLKAKKEFKVELPKGITIGSPVAYVAAHGKVLVEIRRYGSDASPQTQTILLDPETGAQQPVKGDFRPFSENLLRPLQPSGKPNEFWAAVRDEKKKGTAIGRYDAKGFIFTPVLELPELTLKSDEVWVDADAGKVWITYRGHLLRLPASEMRVAGAGLRAEK